jgi:hypothetical protein
MPEGVPNIFHHDDNVNPTLPIIHLVESYRAACRPSWRLLAQGAVIALMLFASLTVLSAQPGGISAGGSRTQIDTTYVPGKLRRPTAEQDSAYERERRLRIDFRTRFHEALRRDSAALVSYLDSLANTPEAIRRRNLTFDPREWQPTAADRARRNEDIAQALDWHNLHPNLPFTPLVAVPLSSIGRALGLTEDVSPHISYTLTITQVVSVKVYDMESNVVATLVDGVQRPGVYSFDWDMLDSSGQRVPYGDYVAEVVANKTMLLAKRIEVP